MDVPAGIQDQARVRVAGRGHAGRLGAPPGDLYVTVHVAPHPLFRREGNDLHLVVPVSVHEAALGAKVEIPAVGGTARLRVPPGTQSGQRFRLRGRGAPSPRDGSRGDLVVELRLVLPAVLDERSKALLQGIRGVERRKRAPAVRRGLETGLAQRLRRLTARIQLGGEPWSRSVAARPTT